jgi:hypothetical protein
MNKKKMLSIFTGSVILAGFVITLFTWTSCSSSDRTGKDLMHKEALSAGFPRILLFRNDKLGLGEGYDYWEELHLPYNGVTKKYVTEEVDMTPEAAEYANLFAVKHPEKLMLLHLNGEQVAIKRREVHSTYFPGHWVYEEGTWLTEDIDATTTTISVESARYFEEEAYIIRGGGEVTGTLPHDIILVPVDESGEKRWYESEYVTVETVDYENNTLKVKRGQYFSKPGVFQQKSTYVAPVAGNGWAGNLLWYYNLSSVCPVDSNGMASADIFFEQITSYFSKDGVLKNFDGIGFDVNYFMATHHPAWDCNNDGIADGGVVDGVNVFRIGDWEFLKRLRDHFGEDFIITCDGWKDENQRAVGVLNGMESEGLCRPNDGYRQISRTLNQHVYWNMYNNAKYKFSYITTKLRHPEDLEMATQLRRLGLGVACCLGVAYTDSNQPEVNGGTLNRPGWLGQPLSEMIFPAMAAEDLLAGSGVSMEEQLLSQFNFNGAEYNVREGVLYVKGTDDRRFVDMKIPGPEIMLPESGDLIVFLEAKAMEGYIDLEEGNRVPRKINIRVDGTPSFILPGETSQMVAMHNDLAGFMGTPGFTPMSFYFRKVGRSDRPVRITFEVEEQGAFAIRNLTAHSAASTVAREFENGVVLVNPSYDEQSFDLVNLFSGNYSYRRILVEEGGADHLYDAHEEVIEYNNGEKITDPSKVVVPGLNALFLEKTDSIR